MSEVVGILDSRLIEEITNVPALWDSGVEDYKLAERKHLAPDR